MMPLYTAIPGLSFPKNSDREYTEYWESIPGHPVLRKTISGDSFLVGKERHTLTITGKGDVVPLCALKIGDSIHIKPLGATEASLFRLEKWALKHIPWEFHYSWSYIFTEVAP